MRKAFELAFSTAYLFAGKRPFFSALGDITFSNSVPIGALLDLRAAVVYTEKNDIQVSFLLFLFFFFFFFFLSFFFGF
jgi:acyl-coenzyme A thioesterase 9